MVQARQDLRGPGKDIVPPVEAAVGHPGGNVVGPERGFDGQAQQGRGVGPAAVEDSRVAFLGHGGGHVRVAAALFQQDPRPRLGILLHDFLNKSRRVDGDAVRDSSRFDEGFLGEHLAGVVRIVGQAVEAQVMSHAIAVEGPAGAVQDRGAHGRAVEPFVVLAQALHIAAVGVGVGQQVVGQAVRLGGDPVGVIGNDGFAVRFGQGDQIGLDAVQPVCQGEEMFPLFQDADGGQHILRRTTGMDFRDLRTRRLDQVGFKQDDVGRTVGAGAAAVGQDLGNRLGEGTAFFLRQQAFIRVDDVRGLVDLAQPVEIIPRRGGGRGRFPRPADNAGQERAGQQGQERFAQQHRHYLLAKTGSPRTGTTRPASLLLLCCLYCTRRRPRWQTKTPDCPKEVRRKFRAVSVEDAEGLQEQDKQQDRRDELDKQSVHRFAAEGEPALFEFADDPVRTGNPADQDTFADSDDRHGDVVADVVRQVEDLGDGAVRQRQLEIELVIAQADDQAAQDGVQADDRRRFGAGPAEAVHKAGRDGFHDGNVAG